MASVSAWTAFIIARTVARHATSARWTSVASEPLRTELIFEDDPRLLPSVKAAVIHPAQHLEFAPPEQAELAEAAEEACRGAFPLLDSADGDLHLIVDEFPDRVEVSVEYSGEPLPAAGLDSFAVTGAPDDAPLGVSGAMLLTRVDRVLYETHDRLSRMTLVKYLPGRAPKF